jgi:hypothetical protein
LDLLNGFLPHFGSVNLWRSGEKGDDRDRKGWEWRGRVTGTKRGTREFASEMKRLAVS